MKLRKGKHKRMLKQLVVPPGLQEYVFKLCQDDFTGAHLGEKKTWTKLSNRFYWTTSYQDTINYVKFCPICSCAKDPPASRAKLRPLLDFEHPFVKVGVDVLELTTSRSGKKYVGVFTDLFVSPEEQNGGINSCSFY